MTADHMPTGALIESLLLGVVAIPFAVGCLVCIVLLVAGRRQG